MTKEQLLDMMVFVVAFKAYIQHLRNTDQELDNSLVGDAAKTSQRYISDMQDAIDQHFEPLVKHQKLKFLEYGLARAQKGSGVKGLVTVVADFFEDFLLWLKSHRSQVQDLFPGALSTPANALCNAVSLDTPEEILSACDKIRPCSRFQLYKWIDQAAGEVSPKKNNQASIMKDMAVIQDTAQELSGVNVLLEKLDPTDPAVEDLAERKADLEDALDKAVATSDNPQLAQTVAVMESLKKRDYASKMGEVLGMTAEQEVALTSRGRAIIAAGAGSGKTRVLAGKVVYHMQELGVHPSQILATSFTKKSAGELKERIEKYGSMVNKEFSVGDARIGTTHSIALRICRDNQKVLKLVGGPNGITVRKGGEDVALIKIAMKQISMKPEVNPAPAPKPKSLFEGLFNKAQGLTVPQTSSPQNPTQPSSLQPFTPSAPSVQNTPTTTQPQNSPRQTAFDALMQVADGYLAWAKSQGFGWSFGPYKTIQNVKYKDVNSLTPQEIAEVNKILSQTGLQKQIDKKAPSFRNFKLASLSHFAAIEDDEGDPDAASLEEEANKAPAQKSSSKGFSMFWKVPANQFFNIGLPEGQFKYTAGDHARFIDQMRAGMVTPSQAYDLSQKGDMEKEVALVFCAYDWLKRNDVVYNDTMNFEDMLEYSVAALIADPTLRNQMQNKLKVLLIDEAQDQNGLQHLLFGLLAGYLDAATLLPKEDGSMTADTFCFIGDDKQAIYSFRGAKPEEFINKSDTKGGDFKTFMLDTNFRSAPEIVEAANQLISHNKNQIPMACKYDPNKANGVIKAKEVLDGVEGIPYVAADLIGEMTLGDEPLASFNDYGVALRTNAEVMNFGLALLEKGIPFRSKLNFFGDPTIKAMVSWLKLSAAGQDINKINDAVLNCFEVPKFNLNEMFRNRIQELARGKNYLEYLNKGGWKYIYQGQQYWRNDKCVKPYMEALNQIWSLGGEAPGDILRAIFSLKGGLVFDKESGTNYQTDVTDALMEKVKSNPEMMNLLREESTTGTVTEDQIKAQAFSTLKPLMGLLSRYGDIGPAVQYISQLQNANEKLAHKDDQEENQKKNPAVVLDTVHGWKGLEVKNLITSFVNGKFPHDRALKENPKSIEEERRLAYVALTRGQESVTVLYPKTVIKRNEEGKPVPMKGASQFISEACLPLERSLDWEDDGDDEGMEMTASYSYSYEEGDWDESAFNGDLPEYYTSDLDYDLLSQD